MFFCPGGRAFARKLCPGTGLLTTSEKFLGVCRGGGGSRRKIPRGLPAGFALRTD